MVVVSVPVYLSEAAVAAVAMRPAISCTLAAVPVGSAARAAPNLVASNSIVPDLVMLMPISDGDRGGVPTGSDAAERMFWFTERTVLSPAKTPAEVLGPVVVVLVVTALRLAISEKMPLTPSTRPEATLVIPAVSLATVSVAVPAVTSLAVMETPGRRSVNVFVDDVTVCAAAVPGQSEIVASCAVL